jgi:hypothetical protein
MTELDMKKMSAAALFHKQSQEKQRDIKETYGDDLLSWMNDYFKEQEGLIKNRAAKLGKLGVDANKMLESMFSYLNRRFKDGSPANSERGTGIPLELSRVQEEKFRERDSSGVDGGEVSKGTEHSGDGEGI